MASAPCASGASRSTGNAVQRRDSSPAVPPSNPETVIECAPHPFTPFDQSRSQIVVSGSVSRFVNVIDSDAVPDVAVGIAAEPDLVRRFPGVADDRLGHRDRRNLR